MRGTPQSVSRRSRRQDDEERAALADLAGDRNTAVHGFYCLVDDGQTQAVSSGIPTTTGIDTVETIPDMRQRYWRDAGPGRGRPARLAGWN